MEKYLSPLNNIASYAAQTVVWPKQGNHIMAQFDQSSIILYQAYNPAIAEAILKSQNFHSQRCKQSGYSMNRMTWIKPNFLWMMYRSGWATKHNQQKILAIRIKIDGFNQILSMAVSSKHVEDNKSYVKQVIEGQQKHVEMQDDKSGKKHEVRIKTKPSKQDEVRLQWDPDHHPTGQKHEKRRAIQLGLRGKILQRFSKEFIIQIYDVTQLVIKNRDLIKDHPNLYIPLEKVYPIKDKQLALSVGVSAI